MPTDLYELMGDKEGTNEYRYDWFAGINGLVAVNVDPEHQDRIKVIIPDVDENEIHDHWIHPFRSLFVGEKGFGDSHRVALGTEVILFGRMSEKYNLFYVPRFNEDYLVPERLRSPIKLRGFHTDEDYLAIADRDFTIEAGRDCKIQAGRKLELRGEQVEIHSADRVEIFAPGGLWVNGVQVIVP